MASNWRSVALRIVAGAAGLVVLAGATHLNVQHAGGYGSGDSLLVIAIAGLVTVGAGFVPWSWRERSRVGASMLLLCLLAGETYWTLTNTERELLARAEAEAPLAKARAKRAEIMRQVKEAEKAKKEADKAAIDQAALPGCRKECANLLTAAKREAEAELNTKRGELERLPAEKPSDGLAEHTGLAPWLLDLIYAGLRSLATAGGPIIIALAAHPSKRKPEAPKPPPASVAKVLLRIVQPAPARHRVEVGDVIRAYVEACQREGIAAERGRALAEQTKAFADAANLRVLSTGEKVYWCGVKLAS